MNQGDTSPDRRTMVKVAATAMSLVAVPSALATA